MPRIPQQFRPGYQKPQRTKRPNRSEFPVDSWETVAASFRRLYKINPAMATIMARGANDASDLIEHQRQGDEL